MFAQEAKSKEYLLRNVSPAGAAPGVIVASPSRQDPDYFFHWVRDAGLVSDVLIDMYRTPGNDVTRLGKLLEDYVDLSSRLQQTPNPSGGLGEPKFNADGGAFNGPWGRPQNDGPAIRAAALARLARLWIAEGRGEQVRRKLYRAEIPAQTVIKADLEYVAHHWRETNFDLWEEVRGDHFYTRLVQRRALRDGARLARELGDNGAADFYDQEAGKLEGEIAKHWNGGRRVIEATLNRTGGLDYKYSNLDSAVILGVLHARLDDGYFSPSDDRVLATVHAQEDAFRAAFPINQRGHGAVAIGRYPEDKYSGVAGSNEGNPWVLTTFAFGELYYRAANELNARGRIQINDVNWDFFQVVLGAQMPGVPATISRGDKLFDLALERMRARGDEFLDRARFHGLADGHFSEQINRYSGYMQSATDLTWNYASYLTAFWAR
jgi:glucoamylase